MKKTENELYQLWMNMSSIPGWYSVLKIVNRFDYQYDDEDFSYLEELDTNFLEIEKQAKKDYYEDKRRYNEQILEVQKKMKEEHREWAKQRKISFLRKQIKRLKSIITSSYEIYLDQQRRDVPFWLRKAILLINNPERLTKLYAKLTSELYFLENKNKSNENQLTKEEIEHARNYPFEKLIEVNQAKFAKCPFHDDHRPSFWIKNNFGHCFSCGKSVDTIQFIIETKNITFPEAVKALNSM